MSIFDNVKPDNVFAFDNGKKEAVPYISNFKENEKAKENMMIPIITLEDFAIEVKDDLEKLSNIAKNFDITNQDSFDQATEMILQSRKIENKIEKTRKKLVRPFLDMQKSINDFAKEFSKICGDIFIDLTRKRSVYQKAIQEEEQRKRREEEEILRKEQEYIRKQQEKNIQENKPPEPIKEVLIPKEDTPVAVQKKPLVKYADGSVQTKKVWSFKIDDFTKIPHEFLQLNESEVKASIAAGVREIKGLTIFEEEKEIFRARR